MVFILNIFFNKGIYYGFYCIFCLMIVFSLVMILWVRFLFRGVVLEVIVFRLFKLKLDIIGCFLRKRIIGGIICSCVIYNIEIWVVWFNFLIKLFDI